MMRSFGVFEFVAGGTIWSGLANAALNVGVNLGQSQLTALLNPTASGSAPAATSSYTYAPATGTVATGAAGAVAANTTSAADSTMTKYLPWAIGGMGLLLLIVILKK
jgi:hypothetical protein